VTAVAPGIAALPSRAERARPGLLAELDRLRAILEDGAASGHGVGRVAPGPVDEVSARLGLSDFERDVLMLAAAVQLDGGIAALVAGRQAGDPRPTFALAMALLPGAHWDALDPDRPLRRWRLVELGAGSTLATTPLTIDERVLHAVTGLGGSSRLGGLAGAEVEVLPLTPGQAELADELAAAVRALDGRVLVRLDGADADAIVGVASRLAAGLGRRLLTVRDAALESADLPGAATLVDRETLIGDRVPVLGSERLLPLLEAPIVVGTGPATSGLETPGRTLLARTVDHPAPSEQAVLWASALGDTTPEVAGAARDLAHHYRLSMRGIRAIAAEWRTHPEANADDLRRLTRERARVGLGPLAERIETRATWADLVLPEGQLLLLHDLALQVRHRATVYEEWGFARQSTRGLGITALFAGESGTGKTMAAEVIASDLGLDLFRIDLSAVVSKYIGETEKNLRSVFDAAEAGGAVLLFDEADALFGKRSDVKDSHDRYANLEVAYLLQRMESYRGLAILTTNLRANVDRAFLRRLRFVVQFPFPDEQARAEVWRHVFPPEMPLEDHDPTALARLQVSGGTIRSIALSAAFAAADAGTPVRREHVLHAARIEYAKAERRLTDPELAALTRGGRR
jgi:ATPase family associated with various cellular activities (AAA)/Winged helix domain, variant